MKKIILIILILVVIIGTKFTTEVIVNEFDEGKSYSWKMSAEIQGINKENSDLVKEVIDVILVNYIK